MRVADRLAHGSTRVAAQANPRGRLIYLRALHSKNRHARERSLQRKLGDIIERRRAAALWQSQQARTISPSTFSTATASPFGISARAGATGQACCVTASAAIVGVTSTVGPVPQPLVANPNRFRSCSERRTGIYRITGSRAFPERHS